MQPTSLAYQSAVQRSHQAVTRFDVIRAGKVVASLPIVDGTVTADRTAAQMRQFTASLGDPDGSLTPEDMSSLLAPFGTRCQIYRGVRIQAVQTASDQDNNVPTWSGGTNNGTIADPFTGELILGWGS